MKRDDTLLSGNWRRLIRYQLLQSAALTMVSNLMLLDCLLLRTGIDIAAFGTVKSSIYLLPALVCILCAPIIQRLNRPQTVCAVSYSLRVVLPLGMPLIPLLTDNRTLIAAGYMVILAASFTCAMLANNSLVAIFKAVLPPENFNRRASLLNSLLSLPSMVLSVPAAWLAGRWETLSDRNFFIAYGILQAVSVLPEIPAVLVITKVRIPGGLGSSDRPGLSLREMLLPLKQRGCRFFMAVVFSRGFQIAMLGTYATVYLIKERNLPLHWIFFAGPLICVLNTILSKFVGSLTDRIGYPGVLMAFSALLLPLFAGFLTFQESVFWLILWIILIFDGNSGLLINQLTVQFLNAASSLSSRERSYIFASEYSLTSSLGSFIGSFAAGGLFSIVSMTVPEEEVFRGYFVCCALLTPPLIAMGYLWRRTDRTGARTPPLPDGGAVVPDGKQAGN